MASSYSTDLKLELMVTGENAGTWGDNTNNNLNLLQQAIAGYEAVTITDSATTALAMTDKTLSNARNMVIKFNTITLTGATTVTIPDGIEKFYIFDCSAITAPTNLTIKTASGTGFTIDAAKIYAAYSNGTDLNEVSLDTLGGSIGTAQIDDNAITSAKISANQVTTAKIADNAITSAKISDLQITQAKIANDAVGPDQLSNTAVTAGSYTTASITVDAQGRITAAASGVASSGFFPVLGAVGPTSGTFNSNANKLYAYAGSGGGAGGGNNPNATPSNGFSGGNGMMAIMTANITPPFSQPYSIGAAGTFPGSQNDPGNPGGSTYISTVFLLNGGQGGSRWQGYGTGTPGTVGSGTAVYSTSNQGQLFGFGKLGPGSQVGNIISGSEKDQSSNGVGALLVFDNS